MDLGGCTMQRGCPSSKSCRTYPWAGPEKRRPRERICFAVEVEAVIYWTFHPHLSDLPKYCTRHFIHILLVSQNTIKNWTFKWSFTKTQPKTSKKKFRDTSQTRVFRHHNNKVAYASSAIKSNLFCPDMDMNIVTGTIWACPSVFCNRLCPFPLCICHDATRTHMPIF